MPRGFCLGHFSPDLPSSFIRPLSASRKRKVADSEGLGFSFACHFKARVWAVSVYSLYAFRGLNLSSKVSSEKRIQLVY